MQQQRSTNTPKTDFQERDPNPLELWFRLNICAQATVRAQLKAPAFVA